MKTAKIVIAAIRLICPSCNEIITASDGSHTLHANIAERWDELSRSALKCNNCGALYKLPANPFKQAVKEQA